MNPNESTNSDPITPTVQGFLHSFTEYRKGNLKWTTVKSKSDEISETQISVSTVYKKKGEKTRRKTHGITCFPNSCARKLTRYRWRHESSIHHGALRKPLSSVMNRLCGGNVAPFFDQICAQKRQCCTVFDEICVQKNRGIERSWRRESVRRRTETGNVKWQIWVT